MSKNNTVTPETAMRLKAAGFPQPERYEADSMYYSVRLGTTHWITPISWLYNQVPDGNMYYMPTITDLLSTLGEVVIRRILTPDGYFYTVAKNVGDDTEITSDYDLAEALALMWEKFNKQ